MDKKNYVMDDPKYCFHTWYQQTKEYDDHYDHTPEWYVLREGADLRDAVAALTEEEEPGGYALRIGSEAELGAEKEEILRVCREKQIMLLGELRESCFFNYCDGREYEIHERTSWGSADDAAQIIDRSLNMVYTEEEKAAMEAKLRHDRRQRELAKGKGICQKRLILNAKKVERELKQLCRKLEEKDPDVKNVPYRESYDVFRKQRQLCQQIEELETVWEYLLHKEELEE